MTIAAPIAADTTPDIANLTPGLYPNVDNDVYQALDCASNSRLTRMIKSAAHCRQAIDFPDDPTPALILGDAFDCLLLTPDQFDSRIVVAGKCGATKKDGCDCGNPGKFMIDGQWRCGVHIKADRHKDVWTRTIDRLLDENCQPIENFVQGSTSRYFERPDGRRVRVSDHAPNARSLAWMLRNNVESIRVDLPPYGCDDQRRIISVDDLDRLMLMKESVTNHPEAKNILSRADSFQMTAIATEPGTGVKCKIRTDITCPLNNGERSIFDVKTTLDASPEGFKKSIYDYGYHRQGGFYPRIMALLDQQYQHFGFIAVEKEPPFAVAVYRLTDEAMELGWRTAEDALAKYGRCERSGKWPAYSEEIVDIGLPDWATRKLEKAIESM